MADLRRDVYRHVLHLSPGFFEVTRTGEVLSRLTTDTSVIQTVIGASVTQALRNVLLTVGGLALLVITNPRLTGLILVVVPARGGADRGDWPPGPAAVAGRAGPHGGRFRCSRGDHQRHPDRPVLRPGGPGERTLRHRHRGRLRRRRPLRQGPRPVGRHRHHPGFRCHHRRALAGWAGCADRSHHGGRALLLRVLCHRRRQRRRWAQRRVRRPAAGRRRHRAAVRPARLSGRDRGPDRARAAARPQRRGGAVRAGQLRLSLAPRADRAGCVRSRRAARRDRGPGRPVRGRQDQRVPAPDALLRPEPGPDPV